MKSRTSFCNAELLRTTMKRYWALWAAYLAFLLLILCMEFTDLEPGTVYAQNLISGGLLDTRWEGLVLAAAGMGALTAMCVFGHLFSRSQTELIGVLPVSRGAVYGSCFFAGLLPVAAADVLAVLVTLAAESRVGRPDVPVLLCLLGTLLLLNLTFYGFAAFCATLTGNLFVVPLVYAVFELVAPVVYLCLESLKAAYLYGYDSGDVGLIWLSPLVWLISSRPLILLNDSGAVSYLMNGPMLVRLGVYAAVGAAFAAAGLLLYRRRAMETATDIVSVRVLRPVFRYCMGFGCALVTAAALCGGAYRFRLYEGGGASIVRAAVLALAGAAVGWFGAEMLMQKSFRVFKKRWKGYVIVALVIVIAFSCLGADVCGFETRVPDAADVQAVYVSAGSFSAELHDPDSIALALDLHESLARNRDAYAEAGRSIDEFTATSGVQLVYILRNGKLMTRRYTLYDPANVPSLSGDVEKLEAVMNTDEGIASRRIPSDITAHTYMYGFVDVYGQEESTYISSSISLDAAQAASLYEAIERDLDERTIGRYSVFGYADPSYTGVTVYIEVIEKTDDLANVTGGAVDAEVFMGVYEVMRDSQNTLAWLRDNLDLTA